MATELGPTIAAGLKRLKLRQTDLARMLEVSDPTVSDWIRGKKRPAPERLEKICRELGIHHERERFDLE